jgi:TolA-binding protein
MGDWFETAMKILVILGSAGVVSVVFGMARMARRVASGRRSAVRQGLLDLSQQGDAASHAELADLRQMVERLNGDVLELQERLDFTERLLAQQRERQALPDR